MTIKIMSSEKYFNKAIEAEVISTHTLDSGLEVQVKRFPSDGDTTIIVTDDKNIKIEL